MQLLLNYTVKDAKRSVRNIQLRTLNTLTKLKTAEVKFSGPDKHVSAH